MKTGNNLMKVLFILITTLMAFQTAKTQCLQWAGQFGGPSTGLCNAIEVDGSGNVYTTGWFQGVCDFDPGPGIFTLTSIGNGDVFITKLDASGNLVWAKQIGGTEVVYAYDMAIDDDGNTYTTGWLYGTADFDPGPGTYNLTSNGARNIYICKLDQDGNFVWAVQMVGSQNGRGYGISVDGSGNVYSTGHFEYSVDFDPGSGVFSLTSFGNFDIFVSKLNSSGQFVWAKQLGGGSDDQGESIDVDNSGNVYTTGSFMTTADFDPGPETYPLTSAGWEDIFLSKLNVSGDFVWAKRLGTVTYDIGKAILVDDNGNVYSTGRLPIYTNLDGKAIGGGALYVSKYSNLGDSIWVKNFGGDYSYDMAIGPDESLYVTGDFSGTTDFDPGPGYYWLSSHGNKDVFISKLDISGNHEWAGSLGGTLDDIGMSITVDDVGNMYTTGFFEGTADFDPGAGTYSLTSASVSDMFVHKMRPFGVGFPDLDAMPDLTVYPNPASTHITIETSSQGQVSIINLQGQELMSQQITQPKTEIDISSLPSGVYLVKLVGEKGVQVGKLVIE